MCVAEAVCQKQNTMGMVRRAIRILESAGENVDAEKAEFLTLFGVPYDHCTKVFVRKVHNPRVCSIEQFRRYESDGTIPSGLEDHLRNTEVLLRDATRKRAKEHPDWCLSPEEERLMDNTGALCLKFNIDPDFYRSEFVDHLYEMEELL